MTGLGSDTTWYNTTSFNDSSSSAVFDKGTNDFLNIVPWRYLDAGQNGISHARIVGMCKSCYTAPQSGYAGSATSVEGRVSIVRTMLHPILSSLVNDILDETDDPALAWQSLSFSVLRMVYYDWLQAFTASTTIHTTSMVIHQAPVHSRGFFMVMGILAANIVIMISIFFWFWSGTRYSLLRSAWQVVAQLKAPETERLLDNATMANDSRVKDMIEEDEALKERRFRITTQEDHDRICLS